MQPGINLDVSEQDYFNFDACSNSRLTDLQDSPAECMFNILHPPKPTPAMVLGSAVDCLTFTPDQVTQRFIVFGLCEELTNKGKGPRCSNKASHLVEDRQLCGLHFKSGRDSNALVPLSQDDYQVAVAMHQAIQHHPTA